MITRPPTLRAVRSAAARALGREPLDVSWYRTPFAQLVRVSVRGDLGDPAPVGEFLPRPHEHLWVVEDTAGLVRFEQQLRDLVRLGPARAPRLRRADPCPWAPCGEHQRPVRFGGVDPDDASLWAGDALDLNVERLRSWAGVRRDEAARAVGQRPDLTTILADAFGAGEFLTVPEVLTLVALAPVDRLSLDLHVETCRRLTAWWNSVDLDLRAVLVLQSGGVDVVPEADTVGLHQDSEVHVVELETPLRGLALQFLASSS